MPIQTWHLFSYAKRRWSVLADRALAHIKRELQQIENLLSAYHELLSKASTSELNLVVEIEELALRFDFRDESVETVNIAYLFD